MAAANAALLLLHPAFATKTAIIETIRKECHNSPAINDLLIRIAHTDFNGLADKSDLNAASDFNL